MKFEVLDVKSLPNKIQINFEKEYWEYNINSKSYKRTRNVPQYNNYGILIKETTTKVDKYKDIQELKKRLGHCKELVTNVILMSKFYENLQT